MTIKTKETKTLLTNFLSLATLQGVNYILPLLTFPYLVKVLGIEYFGLLAFATATIAYFNIIADYGFNLSATKDIATYRDNKEKVTEIFSSVLILKFILIFFSFLLLNILLFSFDKFNQYIDIYYYTFGTVIGQALFPIWFFQGIEKMKYITYINIFAKFLYTIAIFTFINNQSDFYLVPIFNTISLIGVGIWSLIFIKYKFDIIIKLQTISTLLFYFKEGWHLFISRVFVSLYITTNIIILGFFTNNIVVGQYAIIEKIVNALLGFFYLINQTIYPYLSRLYTNQLENMYIFIKKIFLLYFTMGILSIILMYIFKNDIIYLITKKYDLVLALQLMIMSFSLLLAPMNALYSLVLIIRKQNREYLFVIKIAFLANIVLSPLFIYFYGIYGLLGIVIFIQCLSLILNYKYYKIRG